MKHMTPLGWRPHGLGPTYLGAEQEAAEQAAAASPAPSAVILEKLENLEKIAADDLAFRRIATFATVAGAAFAMLRLTEIYFAVQERRERSR